MTEELLSNGMDMKLCQMAVDAMARAYVPYSHHRVGAALLSEDGRIYTGCNIENAAYGPTVCAERTAVFKAVSEGTLHFSAIAVAGGRDGHVEGAFPPCGVCRQVLREFCSLDMPVLIVSSTSPLRYERFTLGELLPRSFGPENLAESLTKGDLP